MNTYDIDVRVSYRVKKTVTEKDEDTAMAVACDEALDELRDGVDNVHTEDADVHECTMTEKGEDEPEEDEDEEENEEEEDTED